MDTSMSIPHYYSPDFRLNGVVDEQIMGVHPETRVEQLNEKILELHPKKELILTICAFAFVAFRITISTLITPTTTFALVAGHYITAIAILGLVFQTINYKKFRAECSKITEQVAALPKEFYYMRRRQTDAALSLDEFNQIKKHLEPDLISSVGINLPIRVEKRYKISSGSITPWSARPLNINVLKESNNEERVLQKYQPWINLLLNIEKSELGDNKKAQLGRAVGWMIHKPYGALSQLVARLDARNARDDKDSVIYYNKVDNKRVIVVKNDDGTETNYHTAEKLSADLIKKGILPASHSRANTF